MGLLISFPILVSAVETPPRLFFSDAKLSFEIAENWEVGTSFPFGPLLTRQMPEGSEASIVCQVSDLVDTGRLSQDASLDVLKAFAAKDLTTRAPTGRIQASGGRTLAGQNAYEVTWMVEGTGGITQFQAVYFFLDGRYYVLMLKAGRDSFPWIVQDFQNWLSGVRRLTRDAAGKLEAPSHGGVWFHQTGGAKIPIPEEWLIGVADDRQVGAAIVRDKMHLAFSAVVNPSNGERRPLSAAEKEDARNAIRQKGGAIVLESEEPFHGLPAVQLVYENSIDGRYVRGQDLWISSPRGRWLINMEGDSKLLRQMAVEWQDLLNSIHFDE